MRTGVELISATKRFAEDDSARSWWCIVSTLILLIAFWAGTLADLRPIVRFGCSVVCGLLILRLFVIFHDQQHHAILPRSRAAEILMRLVGILILSPSSIWRSSHNHHHNHNSKLQGSNIGSFPVMTKEEFLKSSPKVKRNYLFARHPLTILFAYFFMFMFAMCLLPFLRNQRKHVDGLVALLVHAGIGALLVTFGGWQALLLTLVIPSFISSAMGAYLFYAQHNFPTVTFADSEGWTYETAAMESSSCLKTGRIMGWVTANIGYHHIHHLNSRIPFYRLPEVFREIPELQIPKTTSLHPAEIFRCLRLKVWDVESGRMVGLEAS